eukprot:CAMPEP_0197392818 /NCGR_PEP_ID=MMETSP1165-20131217/3940_1 /TAXON_ID=284809 /ORGANISM="Chrysocystis fragilis, Strain CCMP3189" /LENGTH=491 /DNA_ID=CAMNT_0042918459 /DNA_START=74 /DNA_END=1546 /DNA_ORIENTATION=-
MRRRAVMSRLRLGSRVVEGLVALRAGPAREGPVEEEPGHDPEGDGDKEDGGGAGRLVRGDPFVAEGGDEGAEAEEDHLEARIEAGEGAGDVGGLRAHEEGDERGDGAGEEHAVDAVEDDGLGDVGVAEVVPAGGAEGADDADAGRDGEEDGGGAVGVGLDLPDGLGGEEPGLERAAGEGADPGDGEPEAGHEDGLVEVVLQGVGENGDGAAAAAEEGGRGDDGGPGSGGAQGAEDAPGESVEGVLEGGEDLGGVDGVGLAEAAPEVDQGEDPPEEEEPEDGAPAEVDAEVAPHHRGAGDREREEGLVVGDVLTALGVVPGAVSKNGERDGLAHAFPEALEHAAPDERPDVVRAHRDDRPGGEDAESERDRRHAADRVRERSPEEGGHAGDDPVHRQAQVDHRRRRPEVLRHLRQHWHVYVRRRPGERGQRGDHRELPEPQPSSVVPRPARLAVLLRIVEPSLRRGDERRRLALARRDAGHGPFYDAEKNGE